MRNFVMLGILLCLSLKAFSQKDTVQIVRLQEPIARLVVKDLITGDGVKEELAESIKIIESLKAKSSTQDSISSNLKVQLSNLNSIILYKDDQFKLQEKLSKDLQLALRKEKIKNKILIIGAPALLIGALLLK